MHEKERCPRLADRESTGCVALCEFLSAVGVVVEGSNCLLYERADDHSLIGDPLRLC
jgi:hypothetical protein